MKKISLVLSLFLFTAQSFAQEQTLINGPIESGGFGGPVVKFSQVNNKFAVFAGGYGGWVINHSFLIGGGGYGLVNNIAASPAAQAYFGTTNDLRTQFGYGGLVLEYIAMPEDLVHFTVSTLIGGGGVDYAYRYDLFNSNYDESGHASACFVLEPSAGLELNITQFFRINAGASYRLVRGTDLPGISDTDLSDLSGYLTFKFGKF